MDESSKLLLTVGIPTITVLVGSLVNNRQLDGVNKRIDSLNAHWERQISSLRSELMQGILRVEGVLDARLKHLEDKLNIR